MLTVLFGLVSTASAQDLVKYETRNAVTHGKEVASVTFRVTVDGDFGFEVDCGVRKWAQPTQGLAAGSEVKLELTGLPKGEHDCAGNIEVDSPHGSGTLTFRVPVASMDPLDWKATMDDVDLKARTVQPWASRPLKQATAEITSVDGDQLGTIDADLADPQRPLFHWQSTDEVLKVAIVATDVHGFKSSLDLSPWTYEIPHDDVAFATNEAVVTGAEEKKLEKTWSDIQAVLKKFGDYVEINLYVAGYTDTVGSTSSNQGLSERRAQSIARWFKDRGFPGRVYSQGFGESVLAVATPDNTDNEANRRALYLLAASKPRTSDAIPKSAWHEL
ncbi:MAG: OmpA family protein [Alphaproteobacteria bacterium]|nr:OmpA family protein [Alphaproteobacteria bacterium]